MRLHNPRERPSLGKPEHNLTYRQTKVSRERRDAGLCRRWLLFEGDREEPDLSATPWRLDPHRTAGRHEQAASDA